MRTVRSLVALAVIVTASPSLVAHGQSPPTTYLNRLVGLLDEAKVAADART